MWKRIKFYTVTGVVVALAAAVVYLRYIAPREARVVRTVDTPALLKEIQRLNELVTVKYNIQKVIGLKEEKVPFGSESLLLMVQAKVLGGIDLTGLTTQNVVVASDKAVTIQLPAPKILHVYVDEKETKVWDRTKTWWTPWVPFSPDLEQKARLAALESVQAAALDMGILGDSQTNAEITIREFLRSSGVDSVTFTHAPAALH